MTAARARQERVGRVGRDQRPQAAEHARARPGAGRRAERAARDRH